MARKYATTSEQTSEPAMDAEQVVAEAQQPEQVEQAVEALRDAAPLKPNALQGGEFARMQWVVEIEPGVDPQHLLKTEFWAHVAARLQPYHEIVARTKDRAWWAHLLVVDCGPQWASTRFISGPLRLDLSADQTSDIGEHTVAYEGLALGWTVRRKSDAAVIERNLSTRASAIAAAAALMARHAA